MITEFPDPYDKVETMADPSIKPGVRVTKTELMDSSTLTIISFGNWILI